MTDTALVAGGSRGLGLLIARELADRSYRVNVCARDADELERARRQLAAEGHSVTTAVCDVTDSAAVQEWVDGAATPDHPVSVAIPVAGIIQVGSIEAATPETFDQNIDIMTKGCAYLCLAVLPGMLERGYGRIGIVSSIGGVVGAPHLAAYSTAKFGAAGLGQSLHAELGGTGVTVSTILPPLMRTGSHLHAQYSGNRTGEYAWFAPGATVPVLTMDPEKAARRIVDGTLAGKPIVGVSLLTHLAMRVHGIAPATTVRGLRLLGRLLPSGEQPPKAGIDVRQERRNPLVDTLTRVGDRVAQRTNEAQQSATDPPAG